jgi:hypothetical protein
VRSTCRWRVGHLVEVSRDGGAGHTHPVGAGYLLGRFLDRGVNYPVTSRLLRAAGKLSEPVPYPNRQSNLENNCQARYGDNLVHRVIHRLKPDRSCGPVAGKTGRRREPKFVARACSPRYIALSGAALTLLLHPERKGSSRFPSLNFCGNIMTPLSSGFERRPDSQV